MTDTEIDLEAIENSLKDTLKSNSTIIQNTQKVDTGVFDISSVRGIQLYVKAEPYVPTTQSRLLNSRRYSIPVSVTMVCRSRTLNNLHEEIRELYPVIEQTIMRNKRLDGNTNGITDYTVEPYEIDDGNGNPEVYILAINIMYDFILTL